MIFHFFCLKGWCKKHVIFQACFFICFSCCLEQCEPVKCSKNAVGSFKNTMYRKSEKINPMLDFNLILRAFLAPALKTFALFE